MNIRTNEKKNRWKGAFFLLLIANFLFFIGMYFSLFSKNDDSARNETFSGQVEASSFFDVEVTLNANDLQLLLKQSLAELKNEATPQIEVGEKMKLSGILEVLGLPIHYVITGEPFAAENGDIQVKIEKIKLGNLSLPVSQSLQILQSQMDQDLPMRVDDEAGLIYFLLTDVHTEQVQNIKLLEINKEKQEYRFEITLSKESLLQ